MNSFPEYVRFDTVKYMFSMDGSKIIKEYQNCRKIIMDSFEKAVFDKKKYFVFSLEGNMGLSIQIIITDLLKRGFTIGVPTLL